LKQRQEGNKYLFDFIEYLVMENFEDCLIFMDNVVKYYDRLNYLVENNVNYMMSRKLMKNDDKFKEILNNKVELVF